MFEKIIPAFKIVRLGKTEGPVWYTICNHVPVGSFAEGTRLLTNQPTSEGQDIGRV